MDKAYVILLLMAVIVLGVIFFPHRGAVDVNEAKRYVEEDLRHRFPDADVIDVLNVSQVTAESGTYYNLKGRVTMGLDSACPERRHIYYNYPEQKFVPQPDEYITKDCRICLDVAKCVIGFEEEAIIASHTLGDTGAVQQYLNDYGDASPAVSYDSKTRLWNVTWSSKLATETVSVLVSNDAKIV